MIYCPHCHSTMIGRVGVNQYYCRNCFHEFKESQAGVRAYRLTEDGGLDEVKLLTQRGG